MNDQKASAGPEFYLLKNQYHSLFDLLSYMCIHINKRGDVSAGMLMCQCFRRGFFKFYLLMDEGLLYREMVKLIL